MGDGVAQGHLFRRSAIDEGAAIHLAFKATRPGFGIGLAVEGFRLLGKTLAANLRLPADQLAVAPSAVLADTLPTGLLGQ
jgi:hypothetical protein